MVGSSGGESESDADGDPPHGGTGSAKVTNAGCIIVAATGATGRWSFVL